ncbi:MAG TPA: glycosyl hydrolase family 28-related protein [Candidatus Dormibacteraeota bacterium]
MLWKAARIAVVVGACGVLTSAVALQTLPAGVQHRTGDLVPASSDPQRADGGPGASATPHQSGTPGAVSPGPTAAGATSSLASSGPPSPMPSATQAPPPMPLPITSVTAYGAVGDGRTDSTNAIAKALSVAEARGGTLYFPPGHYRVGGSGLGSGIAVRNGRPLTIAGAGSGLVTITNTNPTGGLLSVRVDHTIVEGLTLDAQSANTRQALGVTANDVTVQFCRILGGRQFFAIYFAGPAGATTTAPVYNSGNRLLNDYVDDLVDNDGISWSFQEYSVIENLVHTGSRLALYVDRYVTVQNEIYRPGPQVGGTAGFWISAPSDHITINNFTSYGMGGIISDNGVDVSTNITITNERLMVPGNTLRVDAARGLTIRGCNFGTDGTVLFTGSMATTSVVIEDCGALPMIRFQGSAAVSATFLADSYPLVASAVEHRQTFYNFNSGHPVFVVNGGVWGNRAGGFFGGAAATYTVTNLVGY